jgi:hypothetical protein
VRFVQISDTQVIVEFVAPGLAEFEIAGLNSVAAVTAE